MQVCGARGAFVHRINNEHQNSNMTRYTRGELENNEEVCDGEVAGRLTSKYIGTR
jgi:hypothetical protein